MLTRTVCPRPETVAAARGAFRAVLALSRSSAYYSDSHAFPQMRIASMKTRSIGNLIKRRREALGLSQRALAARVGISATYVSYIETGERRPSSRTLARLATTLNLDKRLVASHAYPELRELFRIDDRDEPSRKLRAWRQFMSVYRAQQRVTEAEQRVLFEVNKLGRVRSARDFVHIIEAIRLSLEE
jgi:transcriptional regulator with XRE-family HTH domain